MNREETLEKIFAQLETMNREQLEYLNLCLDAIEAESSTAPAQKPAQEE